MNERQLVLFNKIKFMFFTSLILFTICSYLCLQNYDTEFFIAYLSKMFKIAVPILLIGGVSYWLKWRRS